jgi:hypothetical protein
VNRIGRYALANLKMTNGQSAVIRAALAEPGK